MKQGVVHLRTRRLIYIVRLRIYLKALKKEKCMHSLQQIKRSNNLSVSNKKQNQQYKKYINNQWHNADYLEDGYYIWKNENGIAYCKEKTPYDGNGNPFLNRSLNDSKFIVKE